MLLLLGIFTQFALADSLYVHGYYDAARIEYERSFFFHPELKQEISPRLNHARAMLEVNEAKGIEALSRIVGEFPDLPADVMNEIALQYMRRAKYYPAIELLRDSGNTKTLGLAYLLDGQLARARDAFLKNGHEELAAEIDDFLLKPKKSERTALLLSLFLPGAGQAYAADPRSAVMDLITNVGSGYLLYNALVQAKYVDASLVFFFLVNRFYIGSLSNAQKACRRYNESVLKEWQKAVVDTYLRDSAP